MSDRPAVQSSINDPRLKPMVSNVRSLGPVGFNDRPEDNFASTTDFSFLYRTPHNRRNELRLYDSRLTHGTHGNRSIIFAAFNLPRKQIYL